MNCLRLHCVALGSASLNSSAACQSYAPLGFHSRALTWKERAVYHRSLPCLQKGLPYLAEWGPWADWRGDRPKRLNPWAPCNPGRGVPGSLLPAHSAVFSKACCLPLLSIFSQVPRPAGRAAAFVYLCVGSGWCPAQRAESSAL